MKLFRIAFVVLGVGAWAGCSGDPGAGVPASDLGTAESAVTSTPASNCTTQTDEGGAFQQFSTSLTRRIHHVHQPDKLITIGVTQTDRWLGDSTKEEDLKVTLNGQPLLHNNIRRYSFTDEIDISQNYYPPYQGVSSAFGEVLGGTLYSYVDGRFANPTAPGTPESAIQFEDGLPGPTVTLDPDVQKAMDDLLSATKTPASQCIAPDTTPQDPNLIAAPNSSAHVSDTRNNGSCQLCRGTCAVVAGSCFYFAATSIACGPFLFFCAAGEIAACTATEVGCDKLCDQNGASCCPVGCGGEGNSNFFGPPPPGSSVGCCTSGEECLNRSNGLCCAGGTTPCGGTDCCAAGDSCVANGNGGQTCCGADAMGCGSGCCPSGQKCGKVDGFPTCCVSCNTTADCAPGQFGSETLCEGGCCVNIPG